MAAMTAGADVGNYQHDNHVAPLREQLGDGGHENERQEHITIPHLEGLPGKIC